MSFAKALSPALREVRILCCQTGAASAGTRQFIATSYPVLKKHNPDLPIMIREANGTPARVFARFERGVEKHVEVDNLSENDVAARVAQLLNLS
ncbi:NDUFA2, NADH ubiquinone oxidoreductase 10.5kD subunit [Daedalea quercina L-15889]|uniref:NDUFA2, NADH ubiquinone oxidoreductase 10.5kD subunit n=1 Tax=Daedalea quercina L-15889 TaxID=1314783 RepID=A0A165RVH3_9APHY|nr:NDUFA2, NADH ubiquinone oxidoreductase 10.5kD subunit [Daedalea quercina L-15889]